MKPIKWQLLLLITISLCTAILRTPGSVRGIALNDFLPAAPGIFPQEGLTPPPFQNLIQNGNFDAGADQWSFWGDIVWEVQNGMLYFYRPATATGAAIFQDISHDSTANSPYEFSVQLGNTANVDKSVMIALHHPGTWDGNIGCVFTIPANSPLQTYVVRGLTTADWPSIRFEIGVNSNDGVPDLMLDDVSVQYKPGITLNETECSAPIPQELNVVRNADFSSNVDQWSFWGDMVWEVQNGRLHFYRPATATGAAVFQDVNYNSTANSPFEFSARFGNTAQVDKTIMVALHHPDTWVGNISCAFTIPANSPLRTYVVRGQTDAPWPNIRFEVGVYSNDGVPGLMMDDVSVQYKPDISLSGTECLISQLYLPLVVKTP